MTRARDLANIADGTFTATDLDLSGTLTVSGDANFDSGTLFVDVSANRVGIGTTSPSTALDVTGTVTADGLTVDGNATLQGASSPTLTITDSDTPTSAFVSATNSSTRFGSSTNTDVFLMSNNTLRIQIDGPTGDISFYEDTGTTPKFFWDASAESLVVGNSSLLTNSAGFSNTLGVKDLLPSITLEDTGTGTGKYTLGVTNGNFGVWDSTRSSYLLYGTAAGNVGIGTSSPKTIINASTSTGAILTLESSDTSLTTNDVIGGIDFYANDGSTNGTGAKVNIRGIATSTAGTITALTFGTADSGSATATERMRIDGSGNLLVGTTTTAGKLTVSAASNHISLIESDNSNKRWDIQQNSGALVFTEFGVADHMTLDSSGNLLVGRSSAFSSSRAEIQSAGSAGTGASECLTLNNTGAQGDMLEFYIAGVETGTIGTRTSRFYFAQTGGSGISMSGVNLLPTDGTGAPNDNTNDIGFSSFRFDDIYATNGTIQTSDINEKQDIAELDEAERRAAVAAKGLLRKFRWKDSVAEKGDEARIHFGIIAQDLQAAFEAEGLDAGRYAMFIHSTWTDEETGEERSRMGVRYSELLAFIIAAL